MQAVSAAGCVLCGGESVPLGRRSEFDDIEGYRPYVEDLARFDREIRRCGGCGLSFVSPMYVAEDFVALYGYEGYSRFQRKIAPAADAYRTPGGKRLLEVWASQFRAVGLGEVEASVRARGRRASMLDVGCGFGRNLLVFQGLGYETTGIEMNPEESEQARALAGCRVVNSDLDSFAATGEKFDCVLASHVIEHVASPAAFVETLGRVLAPDGVLVLETPLTSDHGIHSQRFHDIYHTLFFDHFTLQLATEQAGFEATRWQNITFAEPLGARHIFMQVVARRRVASGAKSARASQFRAAYDALLGDALVWSDAFVEPRRPSARLLRRAVRRARLMPAAQQLAAAYRRLRRWPA